MTSAPQLPIYRRAQLIGLAVLSAGGIAGSIYLAIAPAGLTAHFDTPGDGAMLAERDDSDHDACVNGFSHDVIVSTSATNGTIATLLVNGLRAGDVTVASGKATWPAVKFASHADHVLVAQIGAGRFVSVAKVTCKGAPLCNILGPAFDVKHPTFNGQPSAAGGDRVSSSGSGLQIALDVESGTNTVVVQRDGATILTHHKDASGTWSKVPGITLVDVPGYGSATARVRIKCMPTSGLAGYSVEGLFDGDSVPPQLAVIGPADGLHVWEAGSGALSGNLVGGQVKVCASTTAADALGLSDAMPNAANLCVAIEGATPICAAMRAAGAIEAGAYGDAGPPDAAPLCEGGAPYCSCNEAGTCLYDGTRTGDGACVLITPPGRSDFDLQVSLTDTAGNVTRRTVQAIHADVAAAGDIVIVDPTDGSGPDTTTHVLASDQDASRRDQDASAGGAQYTVTACTSVSDAGVATLMGGLRGQPLASLGTAVPGTEAVPDGGTPKCGLHGRAKIAQFAATLPQSLQGIYGELVSPTELRVDYAGSSSPIVDLWVDSHSPSAESTGPACGDAGLPPCSQALTFVVRDQAGNVSTMTGSAACVGTPQPLGVRYSDLPVQVTVDNSLGRFRYLLTHPNTPLL